MEEPECLVQPDTICSKLDIAAALRESVSFGRFVTEPLEWGKWSTFSQNRYLEEAERYSTRGSVAEKKAYFEAHYKRVAAARKKAAELLEQATAAADYDDDDDADAAAEDDIEKDGPRAEPAVCRGSWRRGCAGVNDETAGVDETEKRLVWGNDDYDGSCSANAATHTTVGTQHGWVWEPTPAYETKPTEELPEAPLGDSDGCGEISQDNTTTTSPCLEETSTSSHCAEEKRNPTTLGLDDHGRSTNGILLSGGSRLIRVQASDDIQLQDSDSVHNISDQQPTKPKPPLYANESTSHLQDFDNIHSSLAETDQTKPLPRYESSPLQENSNSQQIPAWDKAETTPPPLTKPSILSTKSAVLLPPPPLPATPPWTTPTFHGKENNPTPASSRNKARRHANDKPVPAPVNQSPQPKGTKAGTPETTATTQPPPKPDRTWSPKVAFSCFRACQDIGTARGTPRKASARGMPKLEASNGVEDRSKISLSAKTAGQSTKKAEGRWQSLIVSRGKSLSSTGKLDSPYNISSLRIEDRAEKRKEYFQKLEEKLNAEKAERQLKAKEKAENELKSLRQSLSFKARPLPSFYQRTKQPKQS